MWGTLRRIHDDLRARFARYFRAREVASVLSRIHAQELVDTPVHSWAVKKAEQAKEIAAVKGGNFDIVDRRSWAYPYIPEALHRLNQPILKNTPYNLRRFSETPVPRRAINLIKNGVLSLKWRIKIGDDYDDTDGELLKKKRIAEYCLNHPNEADSWRTLMEAVIEDFVIGGYGTMEPQVTPNYQRPFKLWSVDGSTIRIFADWSEATPERPRYAQLTGLKGERGIISFLDEELIYIRDNVRSSTPFGLGKLETCFNTVNAFLGAQDMSTKAAADQVHKTWLWWKTSIPPGQQETIRRHIQNDLEGQAKISLVAGMPQPEVVDVNPVKPDDLLLDWQQFLIRVIAAGFDMSPLSLGIERDVNRTTAEVMTEMDFASSVVPVAKKIEETITRFILHRLMEWKELEFEFLGLEDPNPLVQLQIFGDLYRSNAATPDEIRSAFQIGPPLPGGIGRLTMGQWQLLMFSELFKERMASTGGGQPGGGAGGAGGSGGLRMPGMAPPSMGMPSVPGAGGAVGGGGGSLAAESLHMSPFTAEDVSQMHPDDLQTYQHAGLLPNNNSQLQNEMEQQKPGILETISDDLRSYFEHQDALEEKSEDVPDKITNADQSGQKKIFNKWQHQTTPEEAMSRDIERKRVQLVTRDPFRDVTRVGRMIGPRSGGFTGRFR